MGRRNRKTRFPPGKLFLGIERAGLEETSLGRRNRKSTSRRKAPRRKRKTLVFLKRVGALEREVSEESG